MWFFLFKKTEILNWKFDASYTGKKNDIGYEMRVFTRQRETEKNQHKI